MTTATDAELRDWLALLADYFAPFLDAAGYCTDDAPTPIIPLTADDLLDANGQWPNIVADVAPADWFASVVDPLRLKSKALRDAGIEPTALDAFARWLKPHGDGQPIIRACRRPALAAAIKARDAVQAALQPTAANVERVSWRDALNGRPDLGLPRLAERTLRRAAQNSARARLLGVDHKASPSMQAYLVDGLRALHASKAGKRSAQSTA